jgi:hypothetical protein
MIIWTLGGKERAKIRVRTGQYKVGVLRSRDAGDTARLYLAEKISPHHTPGISLCRVREA